MLRRGRHPSQCPRSRGGWPFGIRRGSRFSLHEERGGSRPWRVRAEPAGDGSGAHARERCPHAKVSDPVHARRALHARGRTGGRQGRARPVRPRERGARLGRAARRTRRRAPRARRRCSGTGGFHAGRALRRVSAGGASRGRNAAGGRGSGAHSRRGRPADPGAGSKGVQPGGYVPAGARTGPPPRRHRHHRTPGHPGAPRWWRYPTGW